MNTMKKWSKQFPKKQGNYWFYGYRYGRVSCGHPCKPEYMFVKVRKCSNGLLYMADGQFMDKSEVEDAHFMPAEMPTPPDINTELTPEDKKKLLHIYLDNE